MQKHIFLIGYMGCGKTTTGKKLANSLRLPFVDTDALIEANEKLSVAEIFKTKGEDYFRKTEQVCLLNLQKTEKSVVSVGGGCPCFNNNISLMKQMGIVIYLERSPKELVNRLLHAKQVRPLIQNKLKDEQKLLGFVEMQLEERSFFYKQANLILDRDNQDVRQILKYV